MAVKNRGASLSMTEIVAEFGGTSPHALSEYYAGSGLVPVTAVDQDGTAIPQAGINGNPNPPISFNNFYGSRKTTLKVVTSTEIWTIPAGVTSVQIVLVGGGGGGGSTKNARGSNTAGSETYGTMYYSSGAGGGAGGVNINNSFPVTAGDTYVLSVGAGGVGGTGTFTYNGTGADHGFQYSDWLARSTNGSQTYMGKRKTDGTIDYTSFISAMGGGAAGMFSLLSLDAPPLGYPLSYNEYKWYMSNGESGGSGGGGSGCRLLPINGPSPQSYMATYYPNGWAQSNGGTGTTGQGKNGGGMTPLRTDGTWGYPCGGGGYSKAGGDNGTQADAAAPGRSGGAGYTGTFLGTTYYLAGGGGHGGSLLGILNNYLSGGIGGGGNGGRCNSSYGDNGTAGLTNTGGGGGGGGGANSLTGPGLGGNGGSGIIIIIY